MLTGALDGSKDRCTIKQYGALIERQTDHFPLARANEVTECDLMDPNHPGYVGPAAWCGRAPTEVPDNSPSETPDTTPSEMPPSSEPENPVISPPEYGPCPSPEVPIVEPPSDLISRKPV